MTKQMHKNKKSLVYYGPHPCRRCDPKGKKGTRIVKAGNGAPDYLEFDYSKKADDVKTDGSWPYPNTHKNLSWKRHKCTDITEKMGRSYMPKSNIKTVKEKKFKVGPYLYIFRKEYNSPWSITPFFNEEDAKDYFEEYCTKYGFDFKWSDYILIPGTITYTLPLSVKKLKK